MRPVTLFVGQWVDMDFETFLATASEIGYQGVELMFRSNIFDMDRILKDPAYCAERSGLLEQYGLSCYSISAAYIGKCVGDSYEPRMDSLVPEKLRAKPDEIRKWAIDKMLAAPSAARLMGCNIVHSFLGSPIWSCFYAYPKRPLSMVEEGYARIRELWLPILDEFKRQGVKLAFEVHPSEIAYDYYTAEQLFKTFDYHEALRLNFDPSHLVWQGVDPVLFIRDFGKYIVHIHMKDVQVRLDGKSGILGSHLEFGDRRRGWDYRSPGHGQVPFEEIIRELNAIGYSGPLSVEWEDNGMDRITGAKDALAFVQRINFNRSEIKFDDQPRYNEMDHKGESTC